MNFLSSRRAGLDLKLSLCLTALWFSFALSGTLNAQEQASGVLFGGTQQSVVLENGTPAMKFVSKNGSVAFVYFRKHGGEDSFAVPVIDWDNWKTKSGRVYFTARRIIFESDENEKRSFDVSREDAKLKLQKNGMRFFTIKVSGKEKRFMISFVPPLPAPFGKHQDPVFEFIEQLMTNYDDAVARFQQAATRLIPTPDQPRSGETNSASLTQKRDQEPKAIIEFSSEPLGAEIYVDGVFTGSTPSKLYVKVGEHSIRVTRPGFKDWERRILVDPASSKVLNAILEKKLEP